MSVAGDGLQLKVPASLAPGPGLTAKARRAEAIRMLKAGDTPQHVAETLRYSDVKAVKDMARTIGLGTRGRRAPPWTVEQLAIFDQFRRDGKGATEIAAATGRGVSAVQLRLDNTLAVENHRAAAQEMVGRLRRCPCCETVFPIAAAEEANELRCRDCRMAGHPVPANDVSLCGCTAAMCAAF